MNPSYEIPQRQTRATTASTTTTTTTGGERSLSPGEQITRRSTRRKRNANGELVESQAVSQDTRTPVKPSAAPGHSSKRPRITKKVPPNSSAAPQVPIKAKNEPGYESINLIEIDDDDGLQQLLSKKQEAILKTQVEGQEKPKLSDFKCVICLDDPKDLAATPCGHMFCDFCLRGALKAGQPATAKCGRCPVCRRKVMIKDVITLEIKISKGKGKGKERA